MFLYFAITGYWKIIRGYQFVHWLNSIYVEILPASTKGNFEILITHDQMSDFVIREPPAGRTPHPHSVNKPCKQANENFVGTFYKGLYYNLIAVANVMRPCGFCGSIRVGVLVVFAHIVVM